MDAAARMDAHDASTRCLQNRPEGGFAQRPQPVIFLLIKNPEEPRDRTDATTRVQICALSRERRHATRRLLISSWILAVAVILIIIAVRALPPPWRGIVALGVVVALAWGVAALWYFFALELRGTELPVPADTP